LREINIRVFFGAVDRFGCALENGNKTSLLYVAGVTCESVVMEVTGRNESVNHHHHHQEALFPVIVSFPH
jgi:hypothetical protein